AVPVPALPFDTRDDLRAIIPCVRLRPRVSVRPGSGETSRVRPSPAARVGLWRDWLRRLHGEEDGEESGQGIEQEGWWTEAHGECGLHAAGDARRNRRRSRRLEADSTHRGHQ